MDIIYPIIPMFRLLIMITSDTPKVVGAKSHDAEVEFRFELSSEIRVQTEPYISVFIEMTEMFCSSRYILYTMAKLICCAPVKVRTVDF